MSVLRTSTSSTFMHCSNFGWRLIDAFPSGLIQTVYRFSPNVQVQVRITGNLLGYMEIEPNKFLKKSFILRYIADSSHAFADRRHRTTVMWIIETLIAKQYSRNYFQLIQSRECYNIVAFRSLIFFLWS